MAAISLTNFLSEFNLWYARSCEWGWKWPGDMSLLYTILMTELVYISFGKSAGGSEHAREELE